MPGVGRMIINPAQLDALFPYVFGFWAAYATAASAFFYFNKNAALKRKVLVILTVATDLALLGLMFATGAPAMFLAFVVAIMVFGAWQTIRFVRFCDKCGANNFPQTQFQARTDCKACGSPLQAAAH